MSDNDYSKIAASNESMAAYGIELHAGNVKPEAFLKAWNSDTDFKPRYLRYLADPADAQYKHNEEQVVQQYGRVAAMIEGQASLDPRVRDPVAQGAQSGALFLYTLGRHDIRGADFVTLDQKICQREPQAHMEIMRGLNMGAIPAGDLKQQLHEIRESEKRHMTDDADGKQHATTRGREHAAATGEQRKGANRPKTLRAKKQSGAKPH